MKVTVERLRWAVAGAVLLLLAGLLLAVSYGRYAARRKWHDLLAHAGVHVTQESDNITWSQSLQGRTLYTIRAKKVVPIEGNKYKLHGVTILLYGKDGESVDRLEGDEFEYDKDAGIAKALGTVHMDIQAPGALSGSKASMRSPQPDYGGKGIIHVVTSGLVYVQKLGVAATDQQVDFEYAGVHCVSKGAEFDTGDNMLHLLADVVLTTQLHGSPAVLRASRADLDRQKYTISLLAPQASSRGDSARAANALLWLRPDGSLDHADASGNVYLQEPGRKVTAQHVQASFNADNLPEHALLSGGVVLEGSAARPVHGLAQEADLQFAPAGSLNQVTAKGSVHVLSTATGTGGRSLQRELQGQQVMAHFRSTEKGKDSQLEQVHVIGAASVRGETLTARSAGKPASASANEVETTALSGDDVLGAFAAGSKPGEQPLLEHVSAHGHTRLQQNREDGAEQVSTADATEITLAPDHRINTGARSPSLQLVSAVQAGHVQIRAQAAIVSSPHGSKPGAVSTAHGDRAAFDGATENLMLAGSAGFEQGGTSVSAGTLRLDQSTGDAEAQGAVQAALSAPGHDTTHVLADHARLLHASQTADFFGTDVHPARLWQAGSQIMAASLHLDQTQQELIARPNAAGGSVEAVFTPAARTVAANAGQQATQTMGEAVHVSSPALNYSGVRHEAVCSGGVRVRQGDLQVRAQQAVVFLSEGTTPGKHDAAVAKAQTAGVADLSGSLERMVFTGGVRLQAPGRAGDGEQLVYTAAEGNYVLTGVPGKPPRIADAQQGTVTGPALLFRSGEKSVIVNGAQTSKGSGTAAGRVHTDVTVRPQNR